MSEEMVAWHACPQTVLALIVFGIEMNGATITRLGLPWGRGWRWKRKRRDVGVGGEAAAGATFSFPSAPMRSMP